MFSRFSEVTEFLYNQLPYFQNQGKSAIKPGLKNIQALCDLRGNPEKAFKSFHIAGTNGKGSSSHMIASILQEAGYKVGLYTSPHLKSFTERIKVNGKDISKKWVIDYVNTYSDAIKEINPSFFEWSVLMAFDYFRDKKVDYAIVEVGLGGRLDSTNIIQPEICLITNIGFDHMEILGDSLDKIAFEKAGIIKKDCPVSISEVREETRDVFMEKASQMGAPIKIAEENFEIISSKSERSYQKIIIRDNKREKNWKIELGLLGAYQAKNCRGILQLFDQLKEEKGIKISKKIILRGFKNVIKNTNLKGRWQKLGEKPLFIADTAHNLDGLEIVTRQLELNGGKNTFILFGVSKDKLKNELVDVLTKIPAEIILVGGKNPRLVGEKELKEFFEEKTGKKYQSFGNVREAIKKIRKKAGKKDIMIVTGSNFIVAEIKEL